MNADNQIPVVSSHETVVATPSVETVDGNNSAEKKTEVGTAEIKKDESGTAAQQGANMPDAQVMSQVATTLATTTTDVVIEEDKIELDDTKLLKGDEQFIGEVRKIIRDEKDKPYQEEEDSEALNKKYLKSRFGVDFEDDKDKK